MRSIFGISNGLMAAIRLAASAGMLAVPSSMLIASAGNAQAGEALPADLQGCASIFDPVGMPSGTDGADEHEYTFQNGSLPPVPNPPFLYRCHLGGFALRFNGVTKVPDWVAEDIIPEEVGSGAERSDDFFVDKTLPEGYSALLSHYKHSGYDRGHQAPAGDFSARQDLMDETFVLSNMGPQVGACFNQGIWRELETAIRNLLPTRPRLIVFTGPIFSGPLKTVDDVKAERRAKAAKVANPPPTAPAAIPPQSPTTGQTASPASPTADVKPAEASAASTGSVAIPTAFFKIVYAVEEQRAMAFRFRNEARCKTSYAAEEFRTTIDAIEEDTGFDFLAALSARRQTILERQVSPFWTW
ncbi:endonuclease G [Neorhizobium galegae]|uniref:DNA/RNA non-specific endonuclease n=1 Tax=Neorhizobium galegae TaxID=399 RepID=UPI001AE7F9A2|nr:DNA/RNA non-specific endonuclease [Neorhizobium galegae]MBP2558234.1 endonuclease G [Neorhizobium galegae]